MGESRSEYDVFIGVDEGSLDRTEKKMDKAVESGIKSGAKKGARAVNDVFHGLATSVDEAMTRALTISDKGRFRARLRGVYGEYVAASKAMFKADPKGAVGPLNQILQAFESAGKKMGMVGAEMEAQFTGPIRSMITELGRLGKAQERQARESGRVERRETETVVSSARQRGDARKAEDDRAEALDQKRRRRGQRRERDRDNERRRERARRREQAREDGVAARTAATMSKAEADAAEQRLARTRAAAKGMTETLAKLRRRSAADARAATKANRDAEKAAKRAAKADNEAAAAGERAQKARQVRRAPSVRAAERPAAEEPAPGTADPHAGLRAEREGARKALAKEVGKLVAMTDSTDRRAHAQQERREAEARGAFRDIDALLKRVTSGKPVGKLTTKKVEDTKVKGRPDERRVRHEILEGGRRTGYEVRRFGRDQAELYHPAWAGRDPTRMDTADMRQALRRGREMVREDLERQIAGGAAPAAPRHGVRIDPKTGLAKVKRVDKGVYRAGEYEIGRGHEGSGTWEVYRKGRPVGEGFFTLKEAREGLAKLARRTNADAEEVAASASRTVGRLTTRKVPVGEDAAGKKQFRYEVLEDGKPTGYRVRRAREGAQLLAPGVESAGESLGVADLRRALKVAKDMVGGYLAESVSAEQVEQARESVESGERRRESARRTLNDAKKHQGEVAEQERRTVDERQRQRRAERAALVADEKEKNRIRRERLADKDEIGNELLALGRAKKSRDSGRVAHEEAQAKLDEALARQGDTQRQARLAAAKAEGDQLIAETKRVHDEKIAARKKEIDGLREVRDAAVATAKETGEREVAEARRVRREGRFAARAAVQAQQKTASDRVAAAKEAGDAEVDAARKARDKTRAKLGAAPSMEDVLAQANVVRAAREREAKAQERLDESRTLRDEKVAQAEAEARQDRGRTGWDRRLAEAAHRTARAEQASVGERLEAVRGAMAAGEELVEKARAEAASPLRLRARGEREIVAAKEAAEARIEQAERARDAARTAVREQGDAEIAEAKRVQREKEELHRNLARDRSAQLPEAAKTEERRAAELREGGAEVREVYDAIAAELRARRGETAISRQGEEAAKAKLSAMGHEERALRRSLRSDDIAVARGALADIGIDTDQDMTAIIDAAGKKKFKKGQAAREAVARLRKALTEDEADAVLLTETGEREERKANEAADAVIKAVNRRVKAAEEAGDLISAKAVETAEKEARAARQATRDIEATVRRRAVQVDLQTSADVLAAVTEAQAGTRAARAAAEERMKDPTAHIVGPAQREAERMVREAVLEAGGTARDLELELGEANAYEHRKRKAREQATKRDEDAKVEGERHVRRVRREHDELVGEAKGRRDRATAEVERQREAQRELSSAAGDPRVRQQLKSDEEALAAARENRDERVRLAKEEGERLVAAARETRQQTAKVRNGEVADARKAADDRLRIAKLTNKHQLDAATTALGEEEAARRVAVEGAEFKADRLRGAADVVGVKGAGVGRLTTKKTEDYWPPGEPEQERMQEWEVLEDGKETGYWVKKAGTDLAELAHESFAEGEYLGDSDMRKALPEARRRVAKLLEAERAGMASLAEAAEDSDEVKAARGELEKTGRELARREKVLRERREKAGDIDDRQEKAQAAWQAATDEHLDARDRMRGLQDKQRADDAPMAARLKETREAAASRVETAQAEYDQATADLGTLRNTLARVQDQAGRSREAPAARAAVPEQYDEWRRQARNNPWGVRHRLDELKKEFPEPRGRAEHDLFKEMRDAAIGNFQYVGEAVHKARERALGGLQGDERAAFGAQVAEWRAAEARPEAEANEAIRRYREMAEQDKTDREEYRDAVRAARAADEDVPAALTERRRRQMAELRQAHENAARAALAATSVRLGGLDDTEAAVARVADAVEGASQEEIDQARQVAAQKRRLADEARQEAVTGEVAVKAMADAGLSDDDLAQSRAMAEEAREKADRLEADAVEAETWAGALGGDEEAQARLGAIAADRERAAKAAGEEADDSKRTADELGRAAEQSSRLVTDAQRRRDDLKAVEKSERLALAAINAKTKADETGAEAAEARAKAAETGDAGDLKNAVRLSERYAKHMGEAARAAAEAHQEAGAVVTGAKMLSDDEAEAAAYTRDAMQELMDDTVRAHDDAKRRVGEISSASADEQIDQQRRVLKAKVGQEKLARGRHQMTAGGDPLEVGMVLEEGRYKLVRGDQEMLKAGKYNEVIQDLGRVSFPAAAKAARELTRVLIEQGVIAADTAAVVKELTLESDEIGGDVVGGVSAAEQDDADAFFDAEGERVRKDAEETRDAIREADEEAAKSGEKSAKRRGKAARQASATQKMAHEDMGKLWRQLEADMAEVTLMGVAQGWDPEFLAKAQMDQLAKYRTGLRKLLATGGRDLGDGKIAPWSAAAERDIRMKLSDTSLEEGIRSGAVTAEVQANALVASLREAREEYDRQYNAIEKKRGFERMTAEETRRAQARIGDEYRERIRLIEEEGIKLGLPLAMLNKITNEYRKMKTITPFGTLGVPGELPMVRKQLDDIMEWRRQQNAAIKLEQKRHSMTEAQVESRRALIRNETNERLFGLHREGLKLGANSRLLTDILDKIKLQPDAGRHQWIEAQLAGLKRIRYEDEAFLQRRVHFDRLTQQQIDEQRARDTRRHNVRTEQLEKEVQLLQNQHVLAQRAGTAGEDDPGYTKLLADVQMQYDAKPALSVNEKYLAELDAIKALRQHELGLLQERIDLGEVHSGQLKEERRQIDANLTRRARDLKDRAKGERELSRSVMDQIRLAGKPELRQSPAEKYMEDMLLRRQRLMAKMRQTKVSMQLAGDAEGVGPALHEMAVEWNRYAMSMREAGKAAGVTERQLASLLVEMKQQAGAMTEVDKWVREIEDQRAAFAAMMKERIHLEGLLEREVAEAQGEFEKGINKTIEGRLEEARATGKTAEEVRKLQRLYSTPPQAAPADVSLRDLGRAEEAGLGELDEKLYRKDISRKQYDREAVELKKKRLADTVAEMERLRKENRLTAEETTRFQREIGRLNRELAQKPGRLRKASRGVWNLGRRMRGLLYVVPGVAAAIFAVRRAFGALNEHVTTFERQMGQVHTLIPVSSRMIADLGDQIRDLSHRIARTPTDMAEGLYYVISAGFRDTADAMMVLEASAKVATAGLASTEETVDALTTVLNAYGREAGDARNVTNLFFKTVEQGKIRFSDLAKDIGVVTATTAQNKVAVEELLAIYAGLTAQGIKSAEAAISIERLISAVASPKRGMARAAERFGIPVGEAALQEHGLLGWLKLVRDTIGDSGDQLNELLDAARVRRAAFPVISNFEKFAGIFDVMHDGIDAADIALQKMNETLETQERLLKNRLLSLWDQLWEKGKQWLLDMGDKLVPPGPSVRVAETQATHMADVGDYDLSVAGAEKLSASLVGFDATAERLAELLRPHGMRFTPSGERTRLLHGQFQIPEMDDTVRLVDDVRNIVEARRRYRDTGDAEFERMGRSIEDFKGSIQAVSAQVQRATDDVGRWAQWLSLPTSTLIDSTELPGTFQFVAAMLAEGREARAPQHTVQHAFGQYAADEGLDSTGRQFMWEALSASIERAQRLTEVDELLGDFVDYFYGVQEGFREKLGLTGESGREEAARAAEQTDIDEPAEGTPPWPFPRQHEADIRWRGATMDVEEYIELVKEAEEALRSAQVAEAEDPGEESRKRRLEAYNRMANLQATLANLVIGGRGDEAGALARDLFGEADPAAVEAAVRNRFVETTQLIHEMEEQVRQSTEALDAMHLSWAQQQVQENWVARTNEEIEKLREKEAFLFQFLNRMGEATLGETMRAMLGADETPEFIARWEAGVARAQERLDEAVARYAEAGAAAMADRGRRADGTAAGLAGGMTTALAMAGLNVEEMKDNLNAGLSMVMPDLMPIKIDIEPRLTPKEALDEMRRIWMEQVEAWIAEGNLDEDYARAFAERHGVDPAATGEGMDKLGEAKLRKLKEEWRLRRQIVGAIRQAAEGTLQVLQGMDAISNDTKKVLSGALKVADAFADMVAIKREADAARKAGEALGTLESVAAFAGPVAAGVTAGLGLLGHFLGNPDEERREAAEQLRELRRIRDSLDDLGKQMAGAAVPEDVDKWLKYIRAMADPNLPANHQFIGSMTRTLEQLPEELRDFLARHMGGRWEEIAYGGDTPGVVTASEWKEIADFLEGFDAGVFTDDFEGNMSRAQYAMQLMGEEALSASQKLDIWLGQLGKTHRGLADHLRDMYKRDPAAFRELLKSWGEALVAQGPELDELLNQFGLTATELQRVVDMGMGYADAAQTSRSAQIGRSITEIQAVEVIAWLEHIAMTLDGIYECVEAYKGSEAIGAMGASYGQAGGLAAADAAGAAATALTVNNSYALSVGDVSVGLAPTEDTFWWMWNRLGEEFIRTGQWPGEAGSPFAG